MCSIQYKNVKVNVKGKADINVLKQSTLIFIQKIEEFNRNKLKEKDQNGNKNTSRASWK